MSDRRGSVGEDQRPPAFLIAIATGCVQLSQQKQNKQAETYLDLWVKERLTLGLPIVPPYCDKRKWGNP